MTPPRLCSLLVALALVHAPMAVKAQIVMVGNCNGGSSLLVIPDGDDAPAKPGGDCAKACHATCERRGKAKRAG